MVSASPSSVFSRKIHIIRFEKQIRILSQLTVIELGPPVWESSTMIWKFYGPLILNTNFIKRESKIGYPQAPNWDLPDWEPAVITTNTMFNLDDDGES